MLIADIYWAGHIHFYNRFDGPIFKGKVRRPVLEE